MDDISLAAEPDLVDVVAGVLTEHGPMTDDQLIAALAGRGVDLGDDPDDALDEVLNDGDGLLTVLADERWASLPALLAGRLFTHRLTGPEVEHDLLYPVPDLHPVDMFTEREEHRRLADGAAVQPVLLPFDTGTLAERGIPLDLISDLGALLLPAGYLRERGLGEGDLITVAVTPDGLRLEVAAEREAPAEWLSGLERRLGAVLEAYAGEPMPLEVALLTACADDPSLFTELLPPLGEALAACGLSYDSEWLAAPGFDLPRWHMDKRRAVIARRHQLDDDDAFAVLVIVTLYERVADLHSAASAAHAEGGEAELAAFAAELTGQPDPEWTDPGDGDGARFPVRAVLPALAEPAVAAAVLAETTRTGGEDAAALGLFAETLEPMAPRTARPALHWLRGKAYERLGDPIRAEAAYLAAESLDPDWPPALVELARYAGDRGDADRGLALLRRAGVPRDHVLVELLEKFQVGPRSDLGRNQPCWCGSGRKYKQCHLRREQRPLDERADWLYRKAGLFLAEGAWRSALVDAAQARAQYSDDPYAMISVLGDPLVCDAVLFEGGAFAEFLAVRGVLLPDDERLLAGQWLLVERSVYEVEQVRRDDGLTVRDLRTGDVHTVRERVGSRQLRAGELICARVVPVGDTMQIFGGIEPVALHERDDLIALLDAEPDPAGLVSLLTRRFAPPALRNTEGDPLVLCKATLKAGDPDTLTAGLDETYERDAPGSMRWLEHDTTDGMRRVRATLRLEGYELTVETNSEARMDRVRDTLCALDPTLTVIDQSRRPARDTREVATLLADTPAGERPAAQLDPAGPELAALDAFIRDYERKWLDESIPALAGQTPRQAAADPTRRGDLIRLLDSFPSEDRPGTMSVERLRTALNLR